MGPPWPGCAPVQGARSVERRWLWDRRAAAYCWGPPTAAQIRLRPLALAPLLALAKALRNG